MRVLVHCADRGIPLYGPSGASEHLRGIVRALSRAGHDVRVAVVAESDARGRWGARVDVPVFVSRTDWPRGLRTLGAERDAATAVRRATGGWRPDMVWERHALHSGAASALRGGVRWLIEVNAPVVAERRAVGAKVPASVARRTRDRLIRADRVVVVSTWLANWAVDQGVRPQRVRVVPNGVEPVTARPSALPVPDGALVVGFVGSFKAVHGVQRLLPLVDALGPDAWLVTVGTGPLTLPSHRRHVAFGQVTPEEVESLVAGFDVGVAPYGPGAPPWFSPLKVLAYRSVGVPVVCGPVPEAARLLGADGGEIVGTRDVWAWAAAVRRQARRRPTPWVRSWDEVVAEALG